MRLALVLVVALGCGKGSPARPPEVTGTLVVGGESLAPLSCRPGRAAHTFVEVVSPKGVLHFEDRELSWAGGKLTCSKLDRSWGGGSRPDGSVYWRGILVFECTNDETPSILIKGDLDLDCGNITADERQQLDGQRQNMRDEQRKARGSGSGS